MSLRLPVQRCVASVFARAENRGVDREIRRSSRVSSSYLCVPAPGFTALPSRDEPNGTLAHTSGFEFDALPFVTSKWARELPSSSGKFVRTRAARALAS
jgi:hypothetical protein